MDTLDNTEWDVLIVGTGLQQSLLALALSRSDKKILHVDDNEYYGGTEAAFSLQEAEEWAKRVSDDSSAAAFTHISIDKPESAESDTTLPSLSFSRSYSLALNPQLIYARSELLQYLVSSKVYRQLDFLAVGSWWVYSPNPETTGAEASTVSESHRSESRRGSLVKVPNGREDVFQDQILDFKAKRALMKFLRFIAEYEEQPEVWTDHRSRPFSAFLSAQFKVPVALQGPLLALTLSPDTSDQTTTEYALPRIARHLRSIGVFGAGFGAVIPKWGGMSELAQVACRACAVGGGVYVLGKGLSQIEENIEAPADDVGVRIKLRLTDGEVLTARYVVGAAETSSPADSSYSKSISIVGSACTPLFPSLGEDTPAPACAVVVFPSGSLPSGSDYQVSTPPVHVFIHNSDTGECPTGQCILYGFTSLGGEDGAKLVKNAVDTLLSTMDITPSPPILWSIHYEQRAASTGPSISTTNDHIINFPPPSLDLAFDGAVLESVKSIWKKIMGDDAGEFLVFDDREANIDDDE
ncbi:hypothetical protein P154DRAFT_621208 [Amniculicola lignicola CBS 123094]|uniref:Rab proteins geranylgeranyltransferase n=1 Tax=Amniculicola lignicola CBS 123094 TaxID=1392246 RepID=A0A6A5WEB7_9PLEO|nr:hypothetical protein P154DRAFT_621208 [Amniculicola lignicola CBS 123094]